MPLARYVFSAQWQEIHMGKISCRAVVFQSRKSFRKRLVIYVTISYGDYGERRVRLGQAQRMQPATRFWKINSGACGRMLTGSLLALQAAKGIYHVKEAIASSTLQIAPSAYIRTHTYTLTQARLLKGWPLPLDRSRWQRGYILPVTVALCCPPGDGAQPLQPASLPWAGPRRASCAVTFMSYKPRWKPERSWNDSLHPATRRTMFSQFTRSEQIRNHFVFICESNESTVSPV